MEYKIIRSYFNKASFKTIWILMEVTVLDIMVVLLMRVNGLGITIPSIIAGILIFLDMQWFLLFRFGNNYWLKDGAIVFNGKNGRYYQYPGDASSIIILNGMPEESQQSRIINGEIVPFPFIALCNGDVFELRTKPIGIKLNYDSMYAIAKDLGLLTVVNLTYSKDLVQLLETDFTGDLYVAKSVYEKYGKEISESYQKWKKEDKTIYIIDDCQ